MTRYLISFDDGAMTFPEDDLPAVAEAARTAGPKHAARFTWTETARQLLEVYRSLVGGSRAARPAALRGE